MKRDPDGKSASLFELLARIRFEVLSNRPVEHRRVDTGTTGYRYRYIKND